MTKYTCVAYYIPVSGALYRSPSSSAGGATVLGGRRSFFNEGQLYKYASGLAASDLNETYLTRSGFGSNVDKSGSVSLFRKSRMYPAERRQGNAVIIIIIQGCGHQRFF